MGLGSEELSLRRSPLLTLSVLLLVASAMALGNLCSEPVTVEFIENPKAERAYGWPLTWYWRSVAPIGAGPPPVPALSPAYAASRIQWAVARFSTSSLIANLVMWLMILALSSVACHWLLRRYRPGQRWRPRFTTLIVLLSTCVLTVLANLSFDVSPDALKATYGWPFGWYWVLCMHSSRGSVYGWDYSVARLAGNLIIWLLTVVAVGLACEWLLHHYRFRRRFSLRAMLATVGIMALFSAWYATARNRARDQDVLIAWAKANGGIVWVERWGPKWLDIVGADPLRRCVIGAELRNLKHQQPQCEELFERMARLSDVRYLGVHLDVLTPEMTASLGKMRSLQSLEIEAEDAESLAALGNLTQLKRLCIKWLNCSGCDGPQFLAGLTKLKSLTLGLYCDDEDGGGAADRHEWFDALGDLSQVERLKLEGSLPIGVLTCLRNLRNLKALTLRTVDFDDLEPRESRACLAAIGKLTQLERLHLGITRKDDLAYLSDLTNLRVLTLWYIGVSYEESEELEKDFDPLSRLPLLPRLEALRVGNEDLAKEELNRLAALPRLKSLDLAGSWLTDAHLAEWARFETLERVATNRTTVTERFLESLAALKRLREIRISPYLDTNERAELSVDKGYPLRFSASEIDGLRDALAALRQSHPGLLVVNEERSADEFEEKGESGPPWPRDSDQTVNRGREAFMRQFTLPLPGP